MEPQKNPNYQINLRKKKKKKKKKLEGLLAQTSDYSTKLQ